MAKKAAPRVNPFTAPRPKGPNPGRIPTSTKYVPPTGTRRPQSGPPGRRTTPNVRHEPEADPDEQAAFARTPLGGEMPRSRRNTQVSAAALANGLTPAQMRMRGAFPVDDDDARQDVLDDEDEANGEESDPVDDSDAGQDTAPEGEPLYTRDDMLQGVEKIIATMKARGLWHETAPDSRASTEAALPPRTTAAQPMRHPADEFMPRHTTRADTQANRPTLPHGAFVDAASGLSAMPITVGDVDRLWDWLRTDGDQGLAFLGKPAKSSPDLHEQLRFLAQECEREGVAKIRALYINGTHFGFAMLAPILAEEHTALLHIYLMKAARGTLATLMPSLVSLARQAVPHAHLAVASADATWARLHRSLLSPLGFVEHTMFVL